MAQQDTTETFAFIEDFSQQEKMVANVLRCGRVSRGVLSDAARAAILDALSELEEEQR